MLHTRIEIGLEKPFSALHLSDTHIALADERDTERKRILAEKRTKAFQSGKSNYIAEFEAYIEYARENRLPVLYTGDLCDFVSYKNLEYAREWLGKVDHFVCAGNHEYSLYVGEAWEDVPYRMQSYALVQAYFRYNLFFDSRIINGINFVALDNGYYRFDHGQLLRMKLEVEKGLPIVLMMHNPLHTDALYRYMTNEKHEPCAYLVGTPKSMMENYDDHRRRQQESDDDTLRFIDYIYGQKNIRAVLAGHLHCNFEDTLPSGIPQIVTAASYRADSARLVEFG